MSTKCSNTNSQSISKPEFTDNNKNTVSNLTSSAKIQVPSKPVRTIKNQSNDSVKKVILNQVDPQKKSSIHDDDDFETNIGNNNQSTAGLDKNADSIQRLFS